MFENSSKQSISDTVKSYKNHSSIKELKEKENWFNASDSESSSFNKVYEVESKILLKSFLFALEMLKVLQ